MKTYGFTQAIVMAIAVISLLFTACSPEEDVDIVDQPAKISGEIMAQFKDLGFDVSDIAITQGYDLLDPALESGNYLLEGDIIITPDNLDKMLQSDIQHTGVVGEQYRTNNLVRGLPRTISVIGYTGGGNALDSKMRTGLQWAINNYNSLNTRLNFTLTFGTNYQVYDIVVYRVSGGGGGSAGFPRDGDPYQFVQIQSGTSNFSTDVVEHVITHEIGHCLGLRHTDFFDRSLSCGRGGNEGAGSVGAIHIPGTPTGFDANSVMLSCFSADEDGEFGRFDREALQFLY